MMIHDGGTTCPLLLARGRDWQDRPAWLEIFKRYDPLIERWCLAKVPDAEAADEIRQRVWIELADRIQTFRYDPQQSFRGWLRQFCRCRCIDFLRARQRESSHTREFDDGLTSRVVSHADAGKSDELKPNACEAIGEGLLREIDAAQVSVRKRVKPRSWDVFWQIAIRDRPIKEVATEHGMSYAATFEAYRRICRMLREEARRGNQDSDRAVSAKLR